MVILLKSTLKIFDRHENSISEDRVQKKKWMRILSESEKNSIVTPFGHNTAALNSSFGKRVSLEFLGL